MTVQLERANIFVRDIEGVIIFLQTAIPELQIRRDARFAEGLFVHSPASGRMIVQLNDNRRT